MTLRWALNRPQKSAFDFFGIIALLRPTYYLTLIGIDSEGLRVEGKMDDGEIFQGH